MNLYLRLFWAMLSSRFKSKISILEDYISYHRVWPNDLDLLGHMNNGRYFTLTDITRLTCLMRAGIWKALRQRNIYPLMAGETAQFRKPLLPFQKYQIKTRATGWDDRFFYVEHIFSSKKGIHAILLIKVALASFGNTKVTPMEMLRFVHNDNEIPTTKLDNVISTWNTSSFEHWDNHKAPSQIAQKKDSPLANIR